jgi:hydroxyacylglutathione hydrolase
MGICTGDFVFVGDVGRPDLLEKAAHVAGTAESGARDLFRSLSWFKTLSDHLQVWPGHGAGSACGKGLSAVPHSTVGYERRFNWALGIADEEEFVSQVLAGQPEPPRYFGEMKRINRAGPPVLGSVSLPERIAEHRVGEVLAGGGTVVDIRAAPDFAAGYLPGTLSIPFNKTFPTWAGSLLPYDRDLYLLIDEGRPGELAAAIKSLLSIGLDRVRGYFGSRALETGDGNGASLERLDELAVGDVKAGEGSLYVLDVRGRVEWEGGHIPGAHLVPLAELPDRIAELPTDRPIAVHCQGGGRSAIATSLLRAHGVSQVSNVTGGFGAWVQAGLPVAKD